MKTKKSLILKALTVFVAMLCFVFGVFVFTENGKNKAVAAGETVEIMNNHFTVNVSGYRADYASDQQVVLQYDKTFTDTNVWLGNGTTGLAATDFGDYLVINGRTYNEIKNENAKEKIYTSVDKQYGHMDWGGQWSPISVYVESAKISISVNRGYLDIGAMTVGIKDGFSYVYNGTTFKIDGDMIFKATVTESNVSAPTFVKAEETVNEGTIEYESCAVNNHADRNGYMGFTVFPLLNKTDASKYSNAQSWLADHYMYFKEYIKINGKSVNYWNIVKYDESISYTPNAINNTITGRVYATPIQTLLWQSSGDTNNGGFQIWINRAWAENVGIDLNNFVVELAEDMPMIAKDGTVCRTSGTFAATRTNGAWSVKVEKEEIMNDHFTVSIDANGYRGDFATDQIIHLNYDKAFHGTAAWLNDKTDGIADGMDLGNYLVINGKTFNEIKAEEAGKYVSADGRTQMSKGGVWSPIAVLADTAKITLQINRGYLDIGAMTVGIKDGFSYVYNGTTFKIDGDMIFKATVTESNVSAPTFVKAEETVNEGTIEYESCAVNNHADRNGYMGFTVFPLLNKTDASKYSNAQSWLADHYMYFKEYIKINGKSVNYWNIVKYDESISYTPNAINNTITGRVYATPIQTLLWQSSGDTNNGGFQIWINRAWAENVGIDLNNFVVELAEDMPMIAKDGTVCRTTGIYKAIRTNGDWKTNGISSPGAAVRLSKKVEGQKDRSAIRFTFETAGANLEGYLNADGTFKSGVHSGAMLIPKDLLGSETLDISNASDKIEQVSLSASDWEAVGNVRIAKIFLYNFPSSQYGRSICARAYITDGEKTIYSDIVTRSMEQVAKSYLLDNDVTDENLKAMAEPYVLSDIINLAEYVERGFVTVFAGTIVKDGAKYEEIKEDSTYTYNKNDKKWEHISSLIELSDENFITIADFPPRVRDVEWESRLQDYVDLGFTTILLTEDDYPILNKDAYGNFIKGELNEAYRIILKRLLSSGLDVWVRNYDNQDDYFSSKELTDQFREYGKITGFYMSDEPFTTNELATENGQPGVAMDSYGGLITWKNTYYPDDFWHINLVPSDSYNHWEDGKDGINGGYGDYIQYYIDNVLKKLTSGGRTVCLDCYPLRNANKNGIYSDYLFDLMTAANKTRDYNKTVSADQKATFGMCVQTFSYYGGRVNTKQRSIASAEEVTFQLYTGMAMGAGMFEYFAYSSDYTEANGVGKGYECITTVNGEKTDLYNYVKAANDKAFGFAKFINAYEWQGAIVSAGKTENENAAGFAMLSGLTLKNGETGALSGVSSDYDALIGCFKQGDKDGYMVTNFTDPNNKRTNTVTLTFSNCDKAAVYINGKLVVVDVSGGNVKFELLPGNAAFVVPL